MSDLISREELMERVLQEEYDKDIHKDSRAKAIHHGEYLHFYKVISEIPTAFDLESVIKKFQEYKSQQSENEMLSDNGKWLVKRVIEECEKILKSAANATNGKNGG